MQALHIAPEISRHGFTREAFHFFLEHAGYATPPGRVASAAALARAEQQAHERRWHVVWTDDAEPWDGDGDPPKILELATLYATEYVDVGGIPLASLGSIADASAEYRRVIAAELASEALAALDTPDACEMQGGGYCPAKAVYLVTGAGQTCAAHLQDMVEFATDFMLDEHPEVPEDRVTVLIRKLPCAPFTRFDAVAASGVLS